MSTRPNILFIFTDQQSGMAMSCAGNDELHTPAMDGLAESGTMFDAAYCTFPLCTPSRASMMTGLMPHECGIMRNGVPLNDAARPRVIGQLLGQAGYECAYGGKWHVPEIAIPEGHGFERISGFNDHQLADACIQFLQRKHDSPFLLVASFDNPHNICEWARQQPLPWGNIPDVPTEDCPNLPSNFLPAPFEPDVIRREQTRCLSVHPTINYPDHVWRHYRNAYFRLTEKVDRQVGRILDQLRQSGLERDTLVVFSSDHGDGMGAHRWNQKSVLFEEVVRIPFIFSMPGTVDEGVCDREHIVSNGLDLLPTLCDYAGIEKPEPSRGRSLRPLLEGSGADQEVGEAVVETVFAGGNYGGTQGRMVRTGRYKYVVYSLGLYREQLFDLQRDPGEMVNLAASREHVDVLNEHRALLRRRCEETDDNPRWLPSEDGGITV